MAFTKSVPDSQNPGIYTLAAVHRSSSPGFVFTTFHFLPSWLPGQARDHPQLKSSRLPSSHV